MKARIIRTATGLLFLLLCYTPLNAQNHIDWNAVRQAYFDKYHPSDTPAWIFPMVFQEGNGGRDTIYIGVDTKGKSPGVGLDTIFGEKWITIDSSKFTAGAGEYHGKVLKVEIERDQFYWDIVFHNGILPLTMWWDAKAFYSDSLPFKDKDPKPRGQGNLHLGGMHLEPANYSPHPCPWQFPLLMSDTSYYPCYRKDSLTFDYDAFDGGHSIGIITLEIVPWTGTIQTGIGNQPQLSDFKIFPQPATDFIRIKTHLNIIGQITIMNIFGQKVKIIQKYIPGSIINIDELKSGIYIIEIQENNQTLIKKIIKR